MNRQQRRQKPSRVFSNKKGPQVVITKYKDMFGMTRFTKTTKILQRLKGKTIVHYESY